MQLVFSLKSTIFKDFLQWWFWWGARKVGRVMEGKWSAAQSPKIFLLSNIYSALYITENIYIVKPEKSFKWDLQLPIFLENLVMTRIRIIYHVFLCKW